MSSLLLIQSHRHLTGVSGEERDATQGKEAIPFWGCLGEKKTAMFLEQLCYLEYSVVQNGFNMAPFRGETVCEPPDLSLVSSTKPWLYTCQCLLFAYRLKRKILNLDQSHAESGPIALSGHPPSFHIGEWLSYVMAKFQSSLMP